MAGHIQGCVHIRKLGDGVKMMEKAGWTHPRERDQPLAHLNIAAFYSGVYRH